MSDYISDLLHLFAVAKQARESLSAVAGHGVHVTIGPVLTLVASSVPHAEYALRTWADASGVALVEHVSRYPDGMQIRTLHAGDIASVQFDLEPIPVTGSADAASSPSQQDRQSLEAL